MTANGHPPRKALRAGSALFLAACPLAVLAQTALPPLPLPHEAQVPGGKLPAHHVRLVGTGMDKALRMVLAAGQQRCRDAGHAMPELPATAPVQQLTYDLYYTASSVTTYKHSQTLKLTASCQVEPETRLEVEVLTAAGLCQISPGRGVQRGPCKLDAAVSAMPAVVGTPPTPVGHSVLAGQSCDQYETRWAGLNSRYCTVPPSALPAGPRRFVPAPATWHRNTPGVLLQISTWGDADPALKVLDLKATQLHLDLHIQPQTAMPTQGTQPPAQAH